jgi:hypothetical protein
MKRYLSIVTFIAEMATLSSSCKGSTGGKISRPRYQVVVIRAGRLFDARSGTIVASQVVLVRGDRIADVGPGLAIPSGASVIDLSNATVMPGMIDAHVHINTGGETEAQRTPIALANAQVDLAAGFTTVLDMDSRGGYNTSIFATRSLWPGSGPADAGSGAVAQSTRDELLPGYPSRPLSGRFQRG